MAGDVLEALLEARRSRLRELRYRVDTRETNTSVTIRVPIELAVLMEALRPALLRRRSSWSELIRCLLDEELASTAPWLAGVAKLRGDDCDAARAALREAIAELEEVVRRGGGA